MANMIMTSIYNHYLTSYSPKKTDARLDNHKKSELKNIYSNILKLNKEAPLYLLEHKSATTSFALSLKEDTRQLQHTILNTVGNTKNDLFKNRIAFSSNENVVSAKYISNNSYNADEISSYEIEVLNLASAQTNTGKFLPDTGKHLAAGNYSFDVTVNNTSYEFQFGVQEEDTNSDILHKLARLFNHANIGLNASVIEGYDDTSALSISSGFTGEGILSGNAVFSIQNSDSDHTDVVDYLGINYIANEASNAHFLINGEKQTSPSNQVTLKNGFEITLNGVTGESGQPATVGLKANVDSLKDNVRNLINGYNSFLDAVNQYKNITSSNKLSYEVRNVARLYRNELDTVGISATADGKLSINEDLLSQSVQSEEAYQLLSPLKAFSSSLFQKGEDISRDPLNYANKKIVAYKNPGKNFTPPYAASNYSGLLFNYYC